MLTQFKRGQVWANPDNEMMMVTKTRVVKGSGLVKVHFVDELGNTGVFHMGDREITNNITRVEV